MALILIFYEHRSELRTKDLGQISIHGVHIAADMIGGYIDFQTAIAVASIERTRTFVNALVGSTLEVPAVERISNQFSQPCRDVQGPAVYETSLWSKIVFVIWLVVSP